MEIENGADDEGAQQQPPQAAPIGNLAFAFQNFLNNLHVQFGQNPENGVDSSSDESDSDDEGSASDEDENGLFQRLIGAANPRRERADASGKFDFILYVFYRPYFFFGGLFVQVRHGRRWALLSRACGQRRPSSPDSGAIWS